FYYHNSFIIADSAGGWVLETAGKEWAAEKVTGVRSISNAITIGSEWTKCSPRLVDTAVENGWCKKRGDFNFARDYSEPVYTTFSAARQRQACTTRLLRGKTGDVKVEDAFAVLRTHLPEEDVSFRPDPGLTGADVCMHAGFGPVRNSQSVGSLVAEVGPTSQTYWVTGTSAPCTGVFKPVWFAGGIPWSSEPAPTGKFDADCLWWRHEQLHRRIIRNYPGLIPLIRADQRILEAEALSAAARAAELPADLADVSAALHHKAEAAEQEWLEAVRANTADRTRFYYRMAWAGFNRQANLTLEN
ncbi:MAG TPA: hypothetical protein PJ988_17715, partial [Anaerolinea sp.]|nr:hypothetical protein [Anaerolinea sp.]